MVLQTQQHQQQQRAHTIEAAVKSSQGTTYRPTDGWNGTQAVSSC